ncbi:CHAT domain-containing protein [Rubrivivax sp. A210]|uniref:CHAT domain-containing protein n=1 Tax=Rubrivivax sp. A210 TaxID=2772301 RepID=UPI00191B0B9C|nr:CHAT domain-containing protein [Rubrivivax sp. A210]CAD5373490.1 CHAT domain-containing protein [Rubrivivax sp. A210]
MAASENSPITFVVPGHARAPGGALRGSGGSGATDGGLGGQVKAAVQVGTVRDGGAPTRLSATPGEDVVALHIAGGPVLYLHPATARDLMRAQGSTLRGGPAPSGDVAVPTQLRWAGLEQGAPTRGKGFLGDVVLSAFEVLTGFAKDAAVKFVASKVVQQVDAQVDAGVYQLAADGLGKSLKGNGRKLAAVPAAAGPLLVLVHGTFVDSVSTFGKLWLQHPQRVRELFKHYQGHVYALDHPTLGASPVANALTLVQALPQGARLHLATHSRGGLVAEALARAASQRSLGPADLAFFPSTTHADVRRQLQALMQAVQAKDIRVERVLRVACPARGTLLASKRFDAYLSVLKWTLDLAGVPVAPSLLGFIAEVARRRANPAEIPGLEAMIPDTPLLNWLNAAPAAIAGELRVVAGDMEGDSIGSWVKTLLADAFYWTDNDIVVQTRSMYGGAPRQGGASFLLDRGGRVSHFSYFANERTAAAVVEGLTQDKAAGFQPIGPLSWQGQDSGGLRGGPAAVAPGSDPTKPAVFVLPGILGSNLAAGEDRVWLSLGIVGGLARIAYRPEGDEVRPDGAIGMVYAKLMQHLAATHDVVEFAYDWRRPLEDEARRLGAALTQALDARQASGRPVRILAHSMGGLLARTMALECPHVWQRAMTHPDARLLMLGTPNAGSWAPMQVLSGDDTFGNALAALGSPLSDHAARQIMAAMPGFLQLQAGLTDPARGLDKTETWAKLAQDDFDQMQQKNWWHGYAGEAQEAVYRWGVPPQPVLDQARALRERLDAQAAAELRAWAPKLLLVVGSARFTPDGFQTGGSDGFVYDNAVDGGDGRVPLASALLPGVATWKLACDHGSLPSEAQAFEAYVELLEKGSTQRLAPLDGLRGGEAPAAPRHEKSRPAHERPRTRPAQTEADVFRSGEPAAEGQTAIDAEAPLRLTLLNGSLSFVAQPLMIGHYRSLLLTGTEAVLDRHVGGSMKVALDAGLYPESAGSNRVFVRQRRTGSGSAFAPPGPQAAIVVGLGEEGSLGTRALVHTVRQGCIAWVQRVVEEGGGSDGVEIAATLMGSGGLGITPGRAARAIAQGVHEANQRLAASGWPRIAGLTLVELYLDRATDAWRELQMLATACPRLYRLASAIASGTGPLRRQQDDGYRGAAYDMISVTSSADGNGLSFALDTRRARTEVRAQTTQRKLIAGLVRDAATAQASDPQLGRALFQLLVPAELEPFLAGEDSMVLELDAGTAPIPWELLDTAPAQDESPPREAWALRTRLLRKLRKSNFRPAPQDARAEDAVLVIGEPLIEEKHGYAPLPGARQEAEAVAQQLTAPGGLAPERVTALIDQPDATRVIVELLARRYRILHIAGHGEPVELGKQGQVLRTRGVVLSNELFLGVDEIRAMRAVPELVFLNCCHLGALRQRELLRPDPGAFAATVADALIEIGVRCVVVAGWAVGDAAAEAFAGRFYRELMAGSSFIAAVYEARRAALAAEPNGKTWAAYQCYGDPNWTFRGQVADAQAGRAPADPSAAIASASGLALALEEIAVRLRHMGAPASEQRPLLEALEQNLAGRWGGVGAVAEAFAVAWEAAGKRDKAITWYEAALAAGDASASIKVYEQLGNLRVRDAAAAGRRARPQSKAWAAALQAIAEAGADLQTLADTLPTVERLCLCGSAAKRRAMMLASAGGPDAQALQAARQAAFDAYAKAEALAADKAPQDLFYPGLNRIAAALVLQGAGCALEATEPVRQSLRLRRASAPGFWSEVAQIEFEWLMAVAGGHLAESLDALRAAFVELHLRADARSDWQSVADQADFVLEPHAAAASDEEAAAARELMALLQGFAN